MEHLAVGNSRIDDEDDAFYQDANERIESQVAGLAREVTPMMLKKLMCEPLSGLSIS